MNSSNDLKTLLNATRGTPVPVGRILRDDPQALAVMSKMVKSRDPQITDTEDRSTYTNIDQTSLHSISEQVQRSVRDSTTVMQMFPDMELAAQILISSILSPKDMVTTELKYSLKEQYLPAEVVAAMVDVLKTNLEVNYRLIEDLPIMLRDILFEKGSYPILVIPESSVDDIINTGTVTKENLKEVFDREGEVYSVGFLGEVKGTASPFTRESLTSLTRNKSFAKERIGIDFIDKEDRPSHLDLNIVVSDNFNFLKMPEIMKSVSAKKAKELIKKHTRTRVSTEDITTAVASDRTQGTELPSDNLAKLIQPKKRNSNDERELTIGEIENKLYRRPSTDARQFTRVKTGKQSGRKSIGRPLVMKLPPESVIPVFSPGDERDHVGYFILVDETGTPLKFIPGNDPQNDLNSSLADNNNGLSSYLIQRANKGLRDDRPARVGMDQATKLYTEMVTTDLAERLKAGIYGRNLSVSDVSTVYQIMMTRTFHNKMTRLVYVPAELLTYMAYKYRDNGTGKSLNDDLQIINALSAVTTLSRVLASVKNSIGITNAHLKFDPDDPDPDKTLEIAMHELARTRQLSFPFGSSQPSDLVDWIQRAQIQYSYEGHPDMPDVGIEVTQSNMSVNKPDDELDEDLRKRRILGYSLTPETVDNGFASEFATTVVANNILLSKRVVQIQQTFTPFLEHYTRTLITNDMVIRDELRSVVLENEKTIRKNWADKNELVLSSKSRQARDQWVEDIIDGFAERLEIGLPKPDSTTLVNQKASLDIFIESLDLALDNAYFPDDIMTPEVAGELSNNAATVKAIYRASAIRNYMAVNNMLPELADLVTTDEDGTPKVDVFEIQKDHVVSISRSAIKFFNEMTSMIEAINADVKNIPNLSGGGSDYSSDDSSSDSEGDGDGSEDGGDAFGDDMFGDMSDGTVDAEGSGEESGSTDESGDTKSDDGSKGSDEKDSAATDYGI